MLVIGRTVSTSAASLSSSSSSSSCSECGLRPNGLATSTDDDSSAGFGAETEEVGT